MWATGTCQIKSMSTILMSTAGNKAATEEIEVILATSLDVHKQTTSHSTVYWPALAPLADATGPSFNSLD